MNGSKIISAGSLQANPFTICAVNLLLATFMTIIGEKLINTPHMWIPNWHGTYVYWEQLSSSRVITPYSISNFVIALVSKLEGGK